MEAEHIKPVDTSNIERTAVPEQAPEPVVDVERKALDDDTRTLAQNAASIEAASQQVEAGLASGQLDVNTALQMKERLRAMKDEAVNALKNVQNREKAYSDRRQREDETAVLREIPQWADKRVRDAEVTALKDYLVGERGMTQEQLSGLGASEVVSEYRKWAGVMKSRMSANERRLHEADEKIRKARADNPDFGKSNAQLAQERTQRPSGNPISAMQADFKSKHGRELSRAEVKTALMTGEVPSR